MKFVTWERWLCRFAVGRRGGVSASFLALHRFLRTGGLEMVLRWRCSHCGKEMARGAIHAAFLLAHWWMCYACDDLVAVYERSCGVRSVLRLGSVLRGVPDLVLSRHRWCAQKCGQQRTAQAVRSVVRAAVCLAGCLAIAPSWCVQIYVSAGCARWCTQQAKCFLAKFSGGYREG